MLWVWSGPASTSAKQFSYVLAFLHTLIGFQRNGQGGWEAVELGNLFPKSPVVPNPALEHSGRLAAVGGDSIAPAHTRPSNSISSTCRYGLLAVCPFGQPDVAYMTLSS